MSLFDAMKKANNGFEAKFWLGNTTICNMRSLCLVLVWGNYARMLCNHGSRHFVLKPWLKMCPTLCAGHLLPLFRPMMEQQRLWFTCIHYCPQYFCMSTVLVLTWKCFIWTSTITHWPLQKLVFTKPTGGLFQANHNLYCKHMSITFFSLLKRMLAKHIPYDLFLCVCGLWSENLWMSWWKAMVCQNLATWFVPLPRAFVKWNGCLNRNLEFLTMSCAYFLATKNWRICKKWATSVKMKWSICVSYAVIQNRPNGWRPCLQWICMFLFLFFLLFGCFGS